MSEIWPLVNGRVLLPYALDRKYPNASKEWGLQYVFPQAKRWVNRKTREQAVIMLMSR